MKRTITFNLKLMLMLGAFFMLLGCESDDAPFESKIILGQESQSVSNAGGEYSMELLTNLDWQVNSDVDWIQFEESNGEKGMTNIYYSVLPNDDDQRTGILKVTASDGTTKEL